MGKAADIFFYVGNNLMQAHTMNAMNQWLDCEIPDQVAQNYWDASFINNS